MNGLFSAFQPNPEDERKVKEAQVMMNSLQQQAQQPAAPQSTGIFGGLKNYFANPVNTANLAASMNSMVINPNDFYNQNARDVKAMQLQKMQQQQAAEQQQLQQQQAAEQQNKTVLFLAQNGRPDLADQVAGGHLPAKDAMTLMNKQVQQVSGAQLGAGYDPNINYNVKSDGSVTPIGSPVTNINNNMGPQFSEGQKAVDKAYADDYLDWTQGGGADMGAQLAQIGTVLNELESGAPLTGRVTGVLNSVGLLGLINQKAENAKEQVQEVVQRNLRLVLGAQFTEKEGERLINRAYNPMLSPEVNASRLKKLFLQMESAFQQKQAMAQHFEQNNYSMQGFKGKQPNIQDFYTALSKFNIGDVVSGYRFLGGDSTVKSNWQKVN